MAYTVILHLTGDVPFWAKSTSYPSRPTRSWWSATRATRWQGPALPGANVIKVIWPIERLTLIEVIESAEEEKIIGFVRE